MKYIKLLIILSIAAAISVVSINIFIHKKSQDYIYSDVNKVPKCYTAIVLGALVSKTGYPSEFLQDRMDVAIELYKNKKIKRFLLTGDHGRKDYDEVNSMKDYLEEKGVAINDIFLDHAGFDTYNSMVRAAKIFQIKDVIIVSQKFHLPRAVYIAREKGLEAYGIIADKRKYSSIKRLRFREVLANMKAFFEVKINKQPRFLGEAIPITGDSRLSYDR